jgi:hypothetical protein
MSGQPFIFGIASGSGSGKPRLAAFFQEWLNGQCAIICPDLQPAAEHAAEVWKPLQDRRSPRRIAAELKQHIA